MKIALTFDAEHPDRAHCPPGTAERVVATLRTAGVRGTFFLQGRWVEAYPHVARQIAWDGHSIGSHSYYHTRLALLSDDGLAADIKAAEAAIQAVTGKNPRPWFRCPWGECSGDARILRVLDTLGYRHVGWHVQADEWDIARTPRHVEQTVVDGVLAAGDGAIVLLHTWPASVPAAISEIVGRLGQAGAKFVTLDELAGSGSLLRGDFLPVQSSEPVITSYAGGGAK